MFSFKKIYKNKIWIYICVFFALISIGYTVSQKEIAIKSIKIIDRALEELPNHIINVKGMDKSIDEKDLSKDVSKYVALIDELNSHLQVAIGDLYSYDEQSYYVTMDKAYEIFLKLKVLEDSFMDKLSQKYSLRFFTNEQIEITNFFEVYNYHREHNIDISPARETFLGLFENTWSLLFGPVFLILMLILAIFLTELKQLDFKVDDGSYTYPRDSLKETLLTIFIPSMVVLSSGLGVLILSIIRKSPFGSIRELLTYNIIKGNAYSWVNPDINFGIYHNIYIIVFLQLLLTVTMSFLTMFLIYKLCRKFMNFGISSVLTFGFVATVILLQRKFINIELYFSLDSIRILARSTNLIIMAALIAFFFYLNFLFRFNREPKFNLSKFYPSENIKGLNSFEVVKLKRSPLFKVNIVVIVVLCIILPFSFGKSSRVLREEALANLNIMINFQKSIMEDMKDLPEDSILNNPKLTLELLEDIQKTYPNKEKNPKAYLKSLLKYNMEGDVVSVGDEENSDNFKNYIIDRIQYFLKNNIKPEDELGTAGKTDNLFFEKDPFRLYLDNMHYGSFEAKGLIGQFIKANVTGFIPLVILLSCLIVSLLISDDLKNNKTTLLFASGKSKSNIYFSKLVTTLIVSLAVLIASYLLLLVIGLLTGGLGEPYYPLITYENFGNVGSYVGNNVAVINIMPKVIIATALFAITLISLIFMISSSGYNMSHIIIAVIVVMGIFIASKGFLGKFAILNPFTYFDPMLFVNGGMNFINNATNINFITGCMVMIMETIIFTVVGLVILNRRKL